MTPEEKRAALDQLLQSRVLRRCDQLKKMLVYICDAEFEGRAHELSEHLIGVQVFGRPASYSPVEDSIVRTRAYELRNKLTRFYATEAPDTPVRVEIDRGAYVPRYTRSVNAQPDAVASAVSAGLQSPGTTDPMPVPSVPTRWMRPALIVSWCILAGLLAFILLMWPSRTKGVAPEPWTAEMDTFWKPFLADETNLVVAYQSRLFINSPGAQLIVRDYRTNDMSEVPKSEPLNNLQKLTGSTEFVENRNYVDFGSINSVFLLTRTLGRRQNRMSLKRSQDLDWTDIFNNNVIFLGQAGIQPRLNRIFEGGDFIEKVTGVVNVHPKPGEQSFYPSEHLGKNDGDKFALLSRIPGPQRGRYILTVGAAHSELPWAITEYVTNPRSMKELVSHLKTPSGQIPEAFQLLLQVTEQSQVPVRIRYVTHHVIAGPEFPDNPVDSKK